MTPEEKNGAITAEDARRLLNYDPSTGQFTWRISPNRRIRPGRTCSVVNSHGYIRIMIKQKSYTAHRLAWLYVHGEWPPHEVDHINGNRTDNRICNLRLATTRQNQGNRRLQKNNMSGVKGVSWHAAHQKWMATIRKNGRKTHLGYFANKEEAASAYQKAAILIFGQFANSIRALGKQEA